MPRPAHALLTWKGVFGSASAPAEEWQFSLKAPTTAAGGTATVPESWRQPMIDAWTTNLRPVHMPHVILTGVQVAMVREDGTWEKTTAGAYVRTELAANVAGGTASGTVYPYQVATCVTLTTARAGATGRGRFFLPAPYYTVGAGDGLLPAANASSIALAAKNFLNALVPTTGPIGVYSSKGYSSTVTGVRVGRALDTQRRRRGDIPEGFATLAL
jgi:hypothetical protein